MRDADREEDEEVSKMDRREEMHTELYIYYVVWLASETLNQALFFPTANDNVLY